MTAFERTGWEAKLSILEEKVGELPLWGLVVEVSDGLVAGFSVEVTLDVADETDVVEVLEPMEDGVPPLVVEVSVGPT